MDQSSNSKKKLIKKFLQLRADALNEGLHSKQLRQVLKESSSSAQTTNNKWKKKRGEFFAYLTDPSRRLHVLLALMAVTVAVLLGTFDYYYDDIIATQCLIDKSEFSVEMFRPRVNCDMCRDMNHVPEERNLSVDDFYQKYSFTGRPVLIKEAISNWTAMSHFSFQFFREVYTKTKGALKIIEEDCQFFPYLTEFQTLADALSMPDERAAFEPGQPPWYIGWSNCDVEVRKILRKHYQRPYFLPADSETVPEDWIFMGGPGPGADIHNDAVHKPSWQAQISGTKTWQLVPSPECEHVCRSLNVTVHKGDIIMVDTNIWYHATFVEPGEISITIGSEYD